MENKDHKEVHEVHHDKDNTGMIIAAVIAIILVVGLIAYFMMDRNDVKDAIDNTGNAVENVIDNDNDEKTVSDVIGSYQAKVGNSKGIDEDTAADEDDYIELTLSQDKTARLVMTEDSKTPITGTFNVSKNKIRITATTNDNTATDNGATTNDNDTTATNDNNDTDNLTDNVTGSRTNTTKTYEFKINDDNTLTYMNGTSEVTLKKVATPNLK